MVEKRFAVFLVERFRVFLQIEDFARRLAFRLIKIRRINECRSADGFREQALSFKLFAQNGVNVNRIDAKEFRRAIGKRLFRHTAVPVCGDLLQGIVNPRSDAVFVGARNTDARRDRVGCHKADAVNFLRETGRMLFEHLNRK